MLTYYSSKIDRIRTTREYKNELILSTLSNLSNETMFFGVELLSLILIFYN